MKKVLITGGNGLVGKEITSLLIKKGYRVAHLGRTKRIIPNVTSFTWDLGNLELEEEALHWADIIIHLAGHSVSNGRWSRKTKHLILESRVKSTKLLFQKLNDLNIKLDYFISASAIGLYGYGNEVFHENSSPGNGFLADVVTKWEKEIFNISELNIPVAVLRIGVVLSLLGGAYKKIAQPINIGFGAPLGSGKQLMSWIHVKDLAGMFLFSIENTLIGAYNAVSSEVVSNDEMTKTIAKELKKPLWMPNVPNFILKLVLGEMSEIALKGSHVSNDKIKKSGFLFKFDNLDSAIKNLTK